VRLARDRGLQVVGGRPGRQPGRRVADGFEVLEVAVRVAGLAFGGRAEHRGDVVVAFDVRLRGEIQVAAVGLRFAGERVLQVLLGLRAFQVHCNLPENLDDVQSCQGIYCAVGGASTV